MGFPYFSAAYSKKIDFEPIYTHNSVLRKYKLKIIKLLVNEKKNNNLINKLIIDKYFGIYNRNGFEYELTKYKGSFNIYLVDFDNVKKMNIDLGYQNVNNLFKQIFNELKNNFIIGRAFSGDEIFFCPINGSNISDIKKICNDYELGFEYVTETIEMNDNINIQLDNMIDNLHKKSIGRI